MKGIITIDIGTTSMRAILYDAAGRIVHVHQRENAPQFFSDGRAEQAPQAWAGILVESLKACADAAAETGISPAGVAVTAQRSSVIPVDANGVPLHPAIMWQDRRTADLACQEWKAEPGGGRPAGTEAGSQAIAVGQLPRGRGRGPGWPRAPLRRTRG